MERAVLSVEFGRAVREICLLDHHHGLAAERSEIRRIVSCCSDDII